MTLKVDEIQNTSGGAVTLTKQEAAKAWAVLENANTASPDLPDSFNTASFTDNGTGNFYINWTNSFSSPDFATVNSGRMTSVDVGAYYSNQLASRTGLIGRAYNSNSNTDFAHNMVASFGDLA